MGSSSEKEMCPTQKGKEANALLQSVLGARSERPNQAMQRTTNRRLRNFHKFNPSIRSPALSVAQTHPALIIRCELASHWRTEVLS